MNLRKLTLTVAILAVLSGVVWYLQRPSAPAVTDARVGQPVLAGDLATKAAKVRIADQGKQVTLEHQADGSWHVADYYDFPADFAKLSRLIDDLTSAKIQRLVTSRPDRLERLEFKDSSITLLDAAGKELWQVTLGKNAEGGGRFLRYGSEPKAYLANLTSYLDTDPKGWADTVLLNLKADELAGIELSFADGKTVAATRAKKDDPWTSAAAPAGKQLKAATIASLISNLTPLRFTDTKALDDPEAVAAKAHSRTVKLTTFDHKTYTVALGRKPEEKKLKPPAPEANPKDEAKLGAPATSGAAKAEPAKPADASAKPSPKVEPEYETIPAGPVFAFVSSADSKESVDALMKKRSFEISEWAFTSLPATEADLWEDAPKPAAESKPVAEEAKPPAKP
ncbi:MAG TPA: DUF4340 domain-containing protein [Lacunisphaera sp.]|jgi:hypothetical protein|nr:DUF4340 domain-containing protein [Lacunisphaera sp.]